MIYHARLAWLPALGLLALSACAQGPCDPNTAGLFGGISCAASGTYAANTGTLQNAATTATAQEGAAYDQAEGAQATSAAATARVNRLRTQLATMNDELDEEQARLANEHATTTAQQARIDQMQQQISALQGQISAAQGQPNPSAAQAQKLQDEKNALLNLANQM